MKKTKILLLVAALLIFVTMFNACGTISSVDKLLNKDYDPSEEVFKSETSISELTGYELVKSNDSFAIFSTVTDEAVSYKVFSLKANRILATFADTKSTFEFDLYKDIPMLLVTKTTTNIPESVEDLVDEVEPIVETAYTAYDATGEVIKTLEKYEPEAPELISYGTCIFDYAAYTIDNNGALTKTVELPEYVLLDFDKVSSWTWNDDYYYILGNNKVSVYDHSFNVVSSYIAPSYYEKISTYVMNNGNIFAQYKYELDEDDRKYDLSICENGKTAKYDLVSIIINAKDGKVKNLKLDYIVEELYSSKFIADVAEYFGETSPLNHDFENIAVISPIIDKKIDDSDISRDIVFMNNKGKALESLKIVDGQLPKLDSIEKIGDDRYIVYTVTGASIINTKGEVLKNMNNELDRVGAYFVSERAIYDLDLEVVYSLVENEAEVIDTVDNTLFVQAETDTGYDVISFCNGDQTTVYTYNEKAEETTTSFEIVDGIGYYIKNSVSKDYKYYNAEGTLLVTTTYELETVTSTDGDIVLVKSKLTADDTSAKYHTFSK